MGFLCMHAWVFFASPFAITIFLSHSKLTDVKAVSKYVHLRFLDVSKNHLSDLSPLMTLAQLLWLKAILFFNMLPMSVNTMLFYDSVNPENIVPFPLLLQIDDNAVSTFKNQPLDQLPYLQWLSLANNHFEDMEGLGGTALESLNLIGWSISQSLPYHYHPKCVHLS